MGVHHTSYRTHLPCRQSQQDFVGEVGVRKDGLRHHFAKPHARQSCRECFHQHRPDYICLALCSNRRFNH
nr:MAG TPA: hypothetical protein [Caudoviricetes sp.]